MQQQQQYQSDDEEQQQIQFSLLSLKLTQQIKDIQSIIITQYGPASIYINQQSQKQNVGYLIQNTTNQIRLASLFIIDQVLLINYEKDVRYYYWNEYNLLKELDNIGLKDQPIYILMNVPISSLESYSSEQTQLRQLNRNIQSQIKQLEDPEELEGYFGDLYYALNGRKTLALILVQVDYDITPEIILLFDEIRKHVPQLSQVYMTPLKQVIKQYIKQQEKDNVHI